MPKNASRILIVEDDVVDLLLLRMSLEQAGITALLDHAEDGEIAINRIDQFEGDVRPQLVILDLNLPKVRGDEVLKYIRRHPTCANIPVAILTSSESDRERRRLYELGADAFISKGHDLDSVYRVGAALKRLLH